MSNGCKAGRVTEVFGAQLLNKFPREQIYFCFLLTVVDLYTIFLYFLVELLIWG
jgi:hypothetical protein